MTGLSIINPWHAIRTLLDPEVPRGLPTVSRFERPILDDLFDVRPNYTKAKFKPMRGILKRNLKQEDIFKDFQPTYFWIFKRDGSEILRFG